MSARGKDGSATGRRSGGGRWGAGSAIAAILGLALVVEAGGQVPFSDPPRRASFTATGGNWNGISSVRVSDDGQVIVFTAEPPIGSPPSPSLTQPDIYARDLRTGAIDLVGIGLAIQPNTTDNFHMSADGRFVLFHGIADNMPGLGGGPQVFLRDRVTGTLELITRTPSGGPGNGQQHGAHGISDTGRYLLFSSSSTDLAGGLGIGHALYRKDRVTGQLENVIVDAALRPRTVTFNAATMSSNGRFIAFGSLHADLVPGDTNNFGDQFLRDMEAPSVTLLSVGPGGQVLQAQSNRPAAISNDGRFAILVTGAREVDPRISPTSQGPFFAVRDQVQDTLRAVALRINSGQPATENVGPFLETPQFLERTRRVLYATSIPMFDPSPMPNIRAEVYLTDIDDDTTVRVAFGPQGFANSASHSPSASRNGRHIAFLSSASNLDPTQPAPTPFRDEVFIVSFQPFGTAEAVGVGTPGTGGIVPLLLGVGGNAGTPIRAIASGFLGGAPLFIAVGSPALPPFTSQGINVFINLDDPVTLLPLPNLGLPGVPGSGSFLADIPVTILNNSTITMQIIALDPGAQSGIATTNGLDLRGS